jgi:hypothetical protein
MLYTSYKKGVKECLMNILRKLEELLLIKKFKTKISNFELAYVKLALQRLIYSYYVIA